MKRFIFASLILFISGCATTSGPTQNEMRNAQFYGKPTEQEARSKIDRYLEKTLFDPYTAKVRCDSPSEKAWIKDNVFNPPHYGYLVHCEINAKNRMGGYVGLKDYWFLFNGNSFDHIDPVRSKGLVQ